MVAMAGSLVVGMMESSATAAAVGSQAKEGIAENPGYPGSRAMAEPEEHQGNLGCPGSRAMLMAALHRRWWRQ